jgi:hypothetical protein
MLALNYGGRVWVIHTPDMNGSSLFALDDAKGTPHETVWTNSLYLYPDRVVVKTYDHARGIWLDAVERVVTPPKLNP